MKADDFPKTVDEAVDQIISEMGRGSVCIINTQYTHDNAVSKKF